MRERERESEGGGKRKVKSDERRYGRRKRLHYTGITWRRTYLQLCKTGSSAVEKTQP